MHLQNRGIMFLIYKEIETDWNWCCLAIWQELWGPATSYYVCVPVSQPYLYSLSGYRKMYEQLSAGCRQVYTIVSHCIWWEITGATTGQLVAPVFVRDALCSHKFEYTHVMCDILDTSRGYQTNEDKIFTTFCKKKKIMHSLASVLTLTQTPNPFP